MFSIIICSVNERYLAEVKQNIEATIGVPFEILVWDNRVKNIGLASVYNILAAQAQYPFVCFVHEDVVLKTPNWGSILLEVFNADPDTALIGIAGGRYKAKAYSGWYSGVPDMDFFHVCHQNEIQTLRISNANHWSANEANVVCIDGVFMVARHSVWEQVRFDERLLKGFHFYDIDFSLRVAKAHKVVVTRRIDLVHLTQGGDYGDRWVNSAFMFHHEHSGNLPFYLDKVPVVKHELKVIKTWLQRLKTEPISFRNKIRWIREQQLAGSVNLLPDLLQFLFYRPSGVYFAVAKAKKLKKQILKK
jgi:hypothetical protein